MTKLAAPRSARVCLVTTEFAGPQRNGGIAVMLSALAELLVAEGHDVTVLCLNGTRVMRGSFDHWRTVWGRRGVRLEPMPAVGSDPGSAPMAGVWARATLARRWHVLAWLEARAFDLAHFNDWGGEALLCATARAQGLALARTRLVLGLHGASDWTARAGDRPPAGLEGLLQMEMERAAPARVDAVWAPGRFMPIWLAGQGAPVPDVRVMPQLMPDPGPALPDTVAASTPIREIVLFGRLEDRKGVGLLLDALDRLATGPRAATLDRVLFLGRAGTVAGRPAGAVVLGRASAWPWRTEILDDRDRDEALAVLRVPGRLALVLAPMENCPLTLLECLALGVPVLASDSGGIPDLIDPVDHGRVLVPHDAGVLAERLGGLLGQPVGAARAAWGPGRDGWRAARAVWRDWHRDVLLVPQSVAPTASRGGGPLPQPMRAPDGRACSGWAAALRAGGTAPVCLLSDSDRLLPDALETLADVLARTGADLLSPGWREGDRGDAGDTAGMGRACLCLDDVPVSACLGNMVAGPGLVLGSRARAVAARDWDPDSGLWGLVAVCVANGCRHRAVPAVLVARPDPWHDPPAARARAPALWAALLTPRDTARLARVGAALVVGFGGPRGSISAPARAVLRRDRRRARALWQSWPWRWSRPLRNRARRRRGEALEPVEPPPLQAPGEASQVLWGMLVSRSWILMTGPRLMAGLWRLVRRGRCRCRAGVKPLTGARGRTTDA